MTACNRYTLTPKEFFASNELEWAPRNPKSDYTTILSLKRGGNVKQLERIGLEKIVSDLLYIPF